MSPKTTLKVRLSVMNFLEFAVWGSYLVSLGIFLNKNGLGSDIPWFYTVQGLVSLFMPGLIGIAADRWIPAQKMLSLCHLLAGIFMILAGWQAYSAISAGIPLEFGPMFTYYTLSVAFFMPTIGLCNSVSFNALTKAGLDTVKDFPPIRVLGTVGFIVAELFVNFTQFQETYMQLFTSGIVSLLLMVYALTLPACPVNAAAGGSLAEKLGLNAFKLFKRKKMNDYVSLYRNSVGRGRHRVRCNAAVTHHGLCACPRVHRPRGAARKRRSAAHDGRNASAVLFESGGAFAVCRIPRGGRRGKSIRRAAVGAYTRAQPRTQRQLSRRKHTALRRFGTCVYPNGSTRHLRGQSLGERILGRCRNAAERSVVTDIQNIEADRSAVLKVFVGHKL